MGLTFCMVFSDRFMLDFLDYDIVKSVLCELACAQNKEICFR